MATLQEIKDYIIVNSDQFFIGYNDFEIFEDDKILEQIIIKALNIFNKYRKKTKVEYIYLENNKKYCCDNYKIYSIINIYLDEMLLTEYNKNLWEYNNYKLLIQDEGNYYVKYLTNYNLEDIDLYNNEFEALLKLIESFVFRYLSNIRGGFNLNDVPFSNNANTLLDISNKLYDEVINDLNINDDWYKFA